MSSEKKQDLFGKMAEYSRLIVEGMKEPYREKVRGKERADSLEDLHSVGEETAEVLRENGYMSVMDVSKASTDELEKVNGLGFCRAAQVQEHAILSIPKEKHGDE